MYLSASKERYVRSAAQTSNDGMEHDLGATNVIEVGQRNHKMMIRIAPGFTLLYSERTCRDRVTTWAWREVMAAVVKELPP